jgi:hypothetical protein
MRCCGSVGGTLTTGFVYSNPNCSTLLLDGSSRLHCLTVRPYYRLSDAARYNYVAA